MAANGAVIVLHNTMRIVIPLRHLAYVFGRIVMCARLPGYQVAGWLRLLLPGAWCAIGTKVLVTGKRLGNKARIGVLCFPSSCIERLWRRLSRDPRADIRRLWYQELLGRSMFWRFGGCMAWRGLRLNTRRPTDDRRNRAFAQTVLQAGKALFVRLCGCRPRASAFGTATVHAAQQSHDTLTSAAVTAFAALTKPTLTK